MKAALRFLKVYLLVLVALALHFSHENATAFPFPPKAKSSVAVEAHQYGWILNQLNERYSSSYSQVGRTENPFKIKIVIRAKAWYGDWAYTPSRFIFTPRHACFVAGITHFSCYHFTPAASGKSADRLRGPPTA